MAQRKKISQWMARHLQKRVTELEQQQRNLYAPGIGTHIRNITLGGDSKLVLDTTQRLGFRLRGKMNGDNLELYAVK